MKRTLFRTTIAQMAMFDAVNAVLDGPYRPFASKPGSVPGASPEVAAIRAAYIVALNEFPAKAATIAGDYNTSIAGVLASPEAIANGIAVGQAAANAVLAARVGDHRNDPELAGACTDLRKDVVGSQMSSGSKRQRALTDSILNAPTARRETELQLSMKSGLVYISNRWKTQVEILV